ADWINPECGSQLELYADRFWTTSDNDRARFHLALPIWAAYEVSSGTSSVREAVQSRLPNPEQAGNSLLLLVDDDDIRAELSRDLEQAGYRVLPAGSGEEVLALARNEQPALILLDLIARRPTAFEVAGLLKHDRRTRNLPVLFLTSLEDAQGATDMGTVGFLPRQPDTGAVISAINAVLTSGLKPLSRVLVVEQDDHLRDYMVMTIQSQGYRVSEASGPEEAMALAERATPEVALVNAKLAQERDYWLLRGLRNTARQAEIYVMADVLDEDEAKAVLRRGASGYSETGQLPNLLDRMRRRQEPD
ncbi:MAG: response regulator, partial [Anaerolineales bacterium]